LENGCKPVFTSLAEANELGQAVTLNPLDAALLSTWAIKTAWTYELSVSSKTATPKSSRRYLFDHRTPPANTQVWVGRSSVDFMLIQATVTTAHRDRPWNDAERRRILWTGLTFRGIAFLIRTADKSGSPRGSKDPKYWQELWPTPGDVAYLPDLREVSALHLKTDVISHVGYYKLAPNAAFLNTGPLQLPKQE
jgi:hypothetical protein